jgi:hypothetical protein
MMKEQSNKLRRSFYKWHRILGLIALIPIICWTISGLSHPFMSNWFRPFIAEESYDLPTESQMKPALTLQQVMDQNHLTGLRNFGLVNFKGQTYYQILQKDSSYNYYSSTNGLLFPNGDRDYAIYLARYFTQDSISKIKDAHLQTNFDGEYQPINHLLPVWKISFDRPDGMDIYVETGQSRLATFNNHTRKTLLFVFEQLHTWDFVAAAFGDQFRLMLMTGVVGVLFLAMLSGLTIYGLFWKRFKEITQNRKDKETDEKRLAHRYHRQMGLIMSFLMFTFFISAGFHLIVKLHNNKPVGKQVEQLVARDELKLDNLHLSVPDSLIKKQALVKFNQKVYYRMVTTKKEIVYVDAIDGSVLKNGDETYALYLAGYYRTDLPTKVKGLPRITAIKQFNNEYGFINKRLPVVQISYPGNDNWYVETATSKLAAHVAGIDRAEGLSFIFLHKFFWMTWAGKDVRDIVSMLSALGILIVALLGLTAFIKNK